MVSVLMLYVPYESSMKHLTKQEMRDGIALVLGH